MAETNPEIEMINTDILVIGGYQFSIDFSFHREKHQISF